MYTCSGDLAEPPYMAVNDNNQQYLSLQDMDRV
jgi:hypothetical protein